MSESTDQTENHRPNGRNGTADDTAVAADYVDSGAPSALRGNIYLTLHTRTAIRVLRGRRADRKRNIQAIIGLYQFSSWMRDIYRSAADDDPYADRTLVHVEKRFDQAVQKLKQHTIELTACLESARNSQMEVEECLALQPRRFRIKTPRYGAQGARLIGDLDRVVRLAFTANHVNQMTREAVKKVIDSAGHEARSVFSTAGEYRHFAITREDIRQQTQRWGLAKEKMGDIEEAYLTGESKPQFGPVRRAIPSGSFFAHEDEVPDPEAFGDVEVEEVNSGQSDDKETVSKPPVLVTPVPSTEDHVSA